MFRCSLTIFCTMRNNSALSRKNARISKAKLFPVFSLISYTYLSSFLFFLFSFVRSTCFITYCYEVQSKITQEFRYWGNKVKLNNFFFYFSFLIPPSVQGIYSANYNQFGVNLEMARCFFFRCNIKFLRIHYSPTLRFIEFVYAPFGRGFSLFYQDTCF